MDLKIDDFTCSDLRIGQSVSMFPNICYVYLSLPIIALHFEFETVLKLYYLEGMDIQWFAMISKISNTPIVEGLDGVNR